MVVPALPVVVGGLTIQKLSLQNGTCCHCHDVRSDTCSKAFVRLMAMAAIASGTGADRCGRLEALRHDTVCALSNSVPHIKMACLRVHPFIYLFAGFIRVYNFSYASNKHSH